MDGFKTNITSIGILSVIAMFGIYIIIPNSYEPLAEWIRHYSRTISVSLTGLLSIFIILSINWITKESEEKDYISIVPIPITLIILIALFRIVEIWLKA